MNTLSLAGDEWRVSAASHGEHPATVPGCVHDALQRACVIPDPDSPGGESAQAFIGRTDWLWRRRFDVEESMLACEHLDLLLESVDAVGTVRVNGTLVGEVASQFVPVRFDVRSLLRAGTNEIEVMLKGTLAEAERLEFEHGNRPVNADGAWGPFSQLRKSACNFGWDWGPCCPTCGFAGDVRIEGWNGSRIDAIRPHIESVSVERALVRIDIDVAGPDEDATILVRDDAGEIIARSAGGLSQRIEIERPPIWWPRGLGAQRLVTIEVELEGGACVTRRTGIRRAEIDDGPDGRFGIRVNGEPVFCRGANWIPSRLFPHGQTIDDVEPLLQEACSANMNMLRVWGGGLYEPDWFYDRCDELGLMVWQDFMFACATYPEHDDMRALVESEARVQIRRLAAHPSIMLWCGGNEDILAWFSWGWRERMQHGQAWGLHYWTELLPALCEELDPTRPYWTESPWSGSVDVHPNDPEVGDRHTWDLKLDGYRELTPRFASEFGHQGPPEVASIEEALGVAADALRPEDLAERQRAWGGDAVQYAPYLEEWFGITPDTPIDFPSWHWACQLLQARAMSIACTWLRSRGDRCEGALIWQLNDVWTGHSWSLLDVRHRRKPVYHAVRAAFDPVGLFLEPVGDALSVVLVNETDSALDETLVVRRVDFDGAELARESHSITCPPRRGRTVITPSKSLREPGESRRELIEATIGDRRVWWFFDRDHKLALPTPECDLSFERLAGGGLLVHLSAVTLLRDAMLRTERFGSSARQSGGLINLLPGDTATIRIDGVDPEQALPDATGLLRSAGDLMSSD